MDTPGKVDYISFVDAYTGSITVKSMIIIYEISMLD